VGGWRRGRMAALAGCLALACALATTTAAAAQPAGQPPARPAPAVTAAGADTVCHTWKHHTGLASRLAADIRAGLRGRKSVVSVEVDDRYLGVECWLHAQQHFYSASVVKATILAALLVKAREQHRALTPAERSLARAMITRSSIRAADALWVDVGIPALQHFLNLAHMNETFLPNPPGIWGLTQITAHDETVFLWLLMKPNSVLTGPERRYELRLMHEIVPWQQWGVRAGAASFFTWHIKNGWTPSTPSGWLINSIGGFTDSGKDYTIVVLTHSDRNKRYGITTIQRVATRVNHDLAAATGP
jgi:hypothetical protein